MLLNEKAPPGMEGWIKSNKQKFLDKHGSKKGMALLYATAWDIYTDKRDGGDKNDEKPSKTKKEDVTLNLSPYEKVIYEEAMQQAKDVKAAENTLKKRGVKYVKSVKDTGHDGNPIFAFLDADDEIVATFSPYEKQLVIL